MSKLQECHSCARCGSEDVTFHEHLNFSYWYCRQCKDEVRVVPFLRSPYDDEKTEIVTWKSPFVDWRMPSVKDEVEKAMKELAQKIYDSFAIQIFETDGGRIDNSDESHQQQPSTDSSASQHSSHSQSVQTDDIPLESNQDECEGDDTLEIVSHRVQPSSTPMDRYLEQNPDLKELLGKVGS